MKRSEIVIINEIFEGFWIQKKNSDELTKRGQGRRQDQKHVEKMDKKEKRRRFFSKEYFWVVWTHSPHSSWTYSQVTTWLSRSWRRLWLTVWSFAYNSRTLRTSLKPVAPNHELFANYSYNLYTKTSSKIPKSSVEVMLQMNLTDSQNSVQDMMTPEVEVVMSSED